MPKISAKRLEKMHQGYLESLSKIDQAAKFRLKHLDIEAKEEAIQEVRALAWKACLALFTQGRDPIPLAGKIGEFSAKKVMDGGRLVGVEPIRDVMSAKSRRRHEYQCEALSDEIMDALSGSEPY